VLCFTILLATTVSGLFRCPKEGPTFTDDACSTCHICHQDLTPTSLPTCENNTLCDVTLGYCAFKDQVVCPSAMRSGWHRTVVLIEKDSVVGQDLFIRGGISHEQWPDKDCTDDARISDCAIDIRIREVGRGGKFTQYNDYAKGDMKLDFYGPEYNQGSSNGQEAEGTALQWTTNDKSNDLYNKFNRHGDHYWVLDMEMDCDKTYNGWFEVKAFHRGGDGWEDDIMDDTEDCTGNIGGTGPFVTTNHMARCGFVNEFHFGERRCEINTIGTYDVFG